MAPAVKSHSCGECGEDNPALFRPGNKSLCRACINYNRNVSRDRAKLEKRLAPPTPPAASDGRLPWKGRCKDLRRQVDYLHRENVVLVNALLQMERKRTRLLKAISAFVAHNEWSDELAQALGKLGLDQNDAEIVVALLKERALATLNEIGGSDVTDR